MKKGALSVAIIEPVGGHGGMDYYDFGLCGGLAAAGTNVVLHTCDETVSPKDAGFEVRHTYTGIYGKTPAWRRGLRYVRGSILAVWSAMRERRHICHFHLFHVGFLEVFNVILAKLLLRRIVITTHDVESFADSLEVPALSRWVYRQADRVIAHNQISRNEVLRCLGVHAHKVSVISSGNYLHVVGLPPSMEEARVRLGLSTTSKVLLFFGQIKEVKRLDVLLEAMPGVLRQHPDALLVIAGRPWGTNFSSYQAQIDKLGISHACLTHIRFISDEELPYYYPSADLVVLPYERIYQSAVVLMAMSFGKAVMVSNLPGMTEIVTDGVKNTENTGSGRTPLPATYLAG